MSQKQGISLTLPLLPPRCSPLSSLCSLLCPLHLSLPSSPLLRLVLSPPPHCPLSLPQPSPHGPILSSLWVLGAPAWPCLWSSSFSYSWRPPRRQQCGWLVPLPAQWSGRVWGLWRWVQGAVVQPHGHHRVLSPVGGWQARGWPWHNIAASRDSFGWWRCCQSRRGLQWGRWRFVCPGLV